MNKKTKKAIIGICMGVLLLGRSTVFSEPGSENDPLVTLSYVNEKMENIKEYIDVKLRNTSSGTGSSNELIVVELSKGQKLIGKSGTEIILRGGKSTAYGVGENKGICDVTKGIDIDNEIDYLPFNHLLIFPRDDGRGVQAHTDSVFMIRGSYEIE